MAMRTTSPSAHEEAREKFGHQCAFGVSTCAACFFFGASPILRALRAVRPACFLRTELALFEALFSPAKLPVTVKPSAVSAARNAFCLRPVTIHTRPLSPLSARLTSRTAISTISPFFVWPRRTKRVCLVLTAMTQPSMVPLGAESQRSSQSATATWIGAETMSEVILRVP